MTKEKVLEQLKKYSQVGDIIWIWNDYCDRYGLIDMYIDDPYDECYLTQEEIDAQVDYEALADFIISEKYWEYMPEIISL